MLAANNHTIMSKRRSHSLANILGWATAAA
jgi:hypothetical protein